MSERKSGNAWGGTGIEIPPLQFPNLGGRDEKFSLDIIMFQDYIRARINSI